VTKALHLIVEGSGEKEAAPLLIRRFLHDHYQLFDCVIGETYNARGRYNLLKQGGLESFLNLARGAPNCAGAIVLLDVEREHRDCPPSLAYSLAQRTKKLNLRFPVVIVCAACEYESWFLLNLHTIAPKFLTPNVKYEGDSERECGSKGWLTRNMPEGSAYNETAHQPRMTALIDIQHTLQQSRSFRRLGHALQQLLAAIDTGENIITPVSPAP
jgi:hypothetical protein